MSSTYKTTNTELVAIYRLEFYKQKKNWKFSQDIQKEKDAKEKKDAKDTKSAKKKSFAAIEKLAEQLNKTYMVEKPGNELDEVFLESKPDTKLAKELTLQTKEEPKGWTNSSKNIALTSILNSEDFKTSVLPPFADTELRDVSGGSTWPEVSDEPQKIWIEDARDVAPQKMWSEDTQWQEDGAKQHVFQPGLWSPTREHQFDFNRDKVWSKEDQIWPQSHKSWPEPVLWRDNELIWPSATHQDQQNSEDATEILWAPNSQRKVATKLLLPDESQQVKTSGGSQLQWLPDVHGLGEGLRSGCIEAASQDLDNLKALSPEVLVSAAKEWLPEPQGDSEWSDAWQCWHACASCSMCEFMRGAHCRSHSSEIELGATRVLDQPQSPGSLSHSALCACVQRHAGLLQALLFECRARDQLSAELDNRGYKPHVSSSYDEYPTRDVALQWPTAPNLGPKQTDNFISGSFLNDPLFDLESSPNANLISRVGLARGKAPGRGRGRLIRDDRVIGIGPGGRPYRL